MGLLDTFKQVLPLLGAAQAAEQRRRIQKNILKSIRNKPPKFEIPLAFRQLMGEINDQYAQAGDAQSSEIGRQFQQNLAHVLGQLQMRGLSSSNLTANLSAGNEKTKQEAIANMRAGLLGQRVGAQQNIGLAGLGASAGDRNIYQQIRGNLLGNLANSTIYPQKDQTLGLLQAGIGLLSGNPAAAAAPLAGA